MTDTLTRPAATIGAAKQFFAPDITSQEFLAEWKRLTEDDKRQILAGLGDGSLTY